MKMDKVAVFRSEKEMAPFVSCDEVDIWEKRDGKWEIIRTVPFPPLSGSTVKELREETERIALLAGEAKAVVCREITGIPFSIFNKKGYCIFSAEEINGDTLDGIMSDILESDEKKRMKEEMLRNARPVETGTPGVYMLNLKDLQKACPDISSKKALVPFLSGTPFLELHLICAHIPPWLERDASYDRKVRQLEGEFHVTLTKKQCEGGGEMHAELHGIG
ncbi:Fe-only nitrogenase accessory AnfO family protein [Lachnospiraceae bacterium 54-53]